MRILRKLTMLFVLATTLTFALPTAAQAAWNPFGSDVCSGKGSTSAVCQDQTNDKTNPLTGNEGLIMRIINVIAIFAGAAAVIIIILAGLRFVTSGGSSEDVAGARRTIVYTSVGLIIIVLGRFIVGYIIGKI